MVVREVTPDEVKGRLTAAVKSHGLTLERFVELGRSDQLDEPELRDLWLIWGDVLENSE